MSTTECRKPTDLSITQLISEEQEFKQTAKISAKPLAMRSHDVELEIEGLKEKLKATREANAELREMLITVQKNESMNQKIATLESQNEHQKETIRTLAVAQENVQKDLEALKKAKQKLSFEMEEKISQFSKENEILTERLKVLTKELETLEKDNKDLKCKLEDLTNDNIFLKTKIGSIEEEGEKLKHNMSMLTKEHDEIRKKLGCKETRLALGQVAWLLEAEIWKIVLPHQNMGKTRVLNSMERWLKRNSGSDEGSAAQERWDILKSKLNWDEEDHKLALKMLKDLRVDDAHPKDVDLEVARKQLNEGDYIAEPDKKICLDIIDMIAKVKFFYQEKK